jgi:hypothetical protein
MMRADSIDRLRGVFIGRAQVDLGWIVVRLYNI